MSDPDKICSRYNLPVEEVKTQKFCRKCNLLTRIQDFCLELGLCTDCMVPTGTSPPLPRVAYKRILRVHVPCSNMKERDYEELQKEKHNMGEDPEAKKKRMA